MNKKTSIACLLVLILTFTTLMPATIAQPTFRLFKFETETDVELGDVTLFENPVSPGTSVEVDVNIKFKFEKPLLFPTFLIGSRIGNWIMFRDSKQDMAAEIELSVESPDFCTAKLEKSKILIENFSIEFNDPVKIKLNVTIKEDAHALETGKIVVKANFTPNEKWSLNESGDVAEIPITTAYKSDITALVENTTIEITPTKTTYIPIDIKNDGNDDAIVDLKVINVPKNWSISFVPNSIEVAADKTETVELNVTSIKGFDNETIDLQFTPKLSKDNSYKGKTISLSLRLENDGSLEESKSEIDIMLLIVLLVAIVAAFIVIILIARRKYKE